MAHPLRPILVQDPNNSYPVDPIQEAQAGKVVARSPKYLQNISKRFDVDKQSPNYFEIDAVPDIWARAIIFEMALFNSDHPLHKHITGEWRGFLTTLALKNMRRIPLDASIIDLNKKDSSFKKVLLKLLPENRLHTETDNKIVYTFTYKKTPIGMSYINTLFCTSAEYKIEKNIISWVDPEKGFFIDPISHLRDEEKVSLAIWLYKLWEELKNTVGDEKFTNRRINEYSLSRVIQLFIADLIGIDTKLSNFATEINENIETLIRKVSVQFEPLEVNLSQDRMPKFQFNGVYEKLNFCIQVKQKSVKHSHVRIIPSDDMNLQKNLLFIDKKIALNWNRDTHDVLIYNNLSLANIPENLSDLGTHKDSLLGVSLVDSLWLTIDDLFNEKVYVIEIDGAIPASRGFGDNELKGLNTLKNRKGKTIVPLIPIKNQLLQCFTTDDLARMLSFEMRGEDNLVIRLNLTLSYNEEGTKREHTVEKSYKINSESYIENTPALHIWPNFSRDDYKGYYTYFYNGGQTISTDTYFYAKPYTYKVQNADTTYYDKNGAFIKEELLEKGNTRIVNKSDKSDNIIDYYVSRTDYYPDAIECIKQTKSTMDSIGYIILKKPKKIQSNGLEFVIGIDFGTTSTNVYVREGNSTKAKSFSKDLVTKVFRTSGSIEGYTSFNFIAFDSLDEVNVPFLTLLRLNNLTKNPEDNMKAISDGIIPFLKGTRDYDQSKEKIKSDLKWSQDKIEYMNTFINQLSIMSAIESLSKGASKIKYRFSYPSAFSRRTLVALSNSINRSISNLNKSFSECISPNAELETEGLAATYFYAIPPRGNIVPRATFNSGVVTIDIGGGTSDISVIEGKDNEFKFRTSLKFAGRELFLTPIIRNPDFLKKFGISDEEIKRIKTIVGSSNKISSEAYTAVDVVVRFNGENIFLNLHKFFNDDQVKEFIQIIRIGLAGLFYYIGLIRKHLISSDKYSSTKIPSIYIGGNGAKVFHWLSEGKYTPDSIDNILFQCMILHERLSSELKNSSERYNLDTQKHMINMHITPAEAGSKPEVAYGLVVDRNDHTAPTLNKHNIPEQFVAGEELKIDDYGDILDKKSFDVIERDDIEKIQVDSIGNSEFAKFLRIFDSCASELEISPIGNVKMDIIEERLKQDLNTFVSKLKNDSKVRESIQDEHVIFMSKLKLLLEMKINEWVSKNS